MLNENIRNLRKQKGYSQETLAQELSVVRQTVSKWEKGYSVPDAVMLERMAELFEVPVGELLGSGENMEKAADYKSDLEKITAQLAILNDQYAREMARKMKMRKIAKMLFFPVLAVYFLCMVVIFLSLFVSCPVNEGLLGYGDVSIALSHEVESEMFTQDEIASATDAVKDYFCSEFEGCTLTEIYYAGDERSARESEHYECEALVLLSSFDVDSSGGDGSLAANSTYENWAWILTKAEDGCWEIVTYGYA